MRQRLYGKAASVKEAGLVGMCVGGERYDKYLLRQTR